MTTVPAVAIITATFNHERFIGPCIESVLGQTVEAWEMVVVDDGSTDATREVVVSYPDPRIRLISQPRLGLEQLAETYRAALDATTAPLVAILEGDDTWPRTKLELQLPRFADREVVLAYGAAGLIDEHGCRYATYRRRANDAGNQNRPIGAVLPSLLEQNFVVAPTVVVRRSALDAIGGFWQPPGVPYVDHPTWLRLALEGSFAFEHRIVGNWRRHAGQFTTSRAVGPQPDNRAFLQEVTDEAARRGLLSGASAQSARIASAPERHERWSQASAFRLALLGGSLGDAWHAARPLLATGKPKWIGLAGAGLGSRMLGGDLEWLFRRTQRFSWPSRRHMRRHQQAQ
jgi:glycosyltransferase involved in cell wall biosynthesis